MSTGDEPTRWERIYAVVRRIPYGRVATYGEVARLADLEGHARQVGYALFALPASSDVPWHRVVNASGRISRRARSDAHEMQRLLLAAEGITLDARGRVDLARLGWPPRGSGR